jgi:hypothetical protein
MLNINEILFCKLRHIVELQLSVGQLEDLVFFLSSRWQFQKRDDL